MFCCVTWLVQLDAGTACWPSAVWPSARAQLSFWFLQWLVQLAGSSTVVPTALQIGFSGDMEPVLGLNLITRSMLAFLNRHLPLTADQRQRFHDKPYPTLDSKHGQRPDRAADISALAGQVAAVVAEAEGSDPSDGE